MKNTEYIGIVERIRAHHVLYDQDEGEAIVSFKATYAQALSELARIRAEAKAEERREAAERFWKELHEEAENQYDRRLELLGPIETSDDAAFRKTLHDGWSAWLLAKRIIANRRAAILTDQAKNTNSAAKVKIIEPGPGGIDGIMTFADQAPEAGKVEGPQAFNTILACALCGETKGTPYKSGDICPACTYGRLRRVERRIQEGR